MGRKTIDLTGQRFGRLSVIRRVPREPGASGQAKWLCRCDCGTLKSVGSNALRSEATQSCGCLLTEVLVTRNTGRNATDLTGKRFGRLMVISQVPREQGSPAPVSWVCECDCGGSTAVAGASLRSGNTRSCGCLRRDTTTVRNTTHGAKPRTGASPTYSSWMNMLRRCEKPDHPRYADWGGRGITVCERWHVFTAFLDDMGEKPGGLTLDRKDNDGGYWCGHCPECKSLGRPKNCHWTTHARQQVNRRGFKLTPDVVQKIQGFADDGLTISAISAQTGLGRHTVAKALFKA